ncbi:MAG: cytochrome C [Alphaproteobacteria bacterium]|nr:cytochrome C [Alphaproteobacteria bacterium]
MDPREGLHRSREHGGVARRHVLGVAAVALAAPWVRRAAAAEARVVVAGGGFAGATAARTLKRLAPALQVTLVEPEAVYTACPFSNAVIAGLRDMEGQRFGYTALRREGIEVVHRAARGLDGTMRALELDDGTRLSFQRLVLAPGIDLGFDALPGYDPAAAEILPHAWRAGAQTLLLRRQLEAMDEGGTVVMSVPANPFRCPPGPYERASLIAHFLKLRKPRAKLLILDAKDIFSKQRLFQQEWARLYPGLIEWVGLSKGGKVTSVDAGARTLVTEFGRHQGQVVNVIPPQRAGLLAERCGVADRSLWCPVDPLTFESRRVPGVHVVGDAAIMGAMPKSAFAANAQAKIAAAAIVALLSGRPPAEPRPLNTCYSLTAPDRAISIAGVYRPLGGQLADVPGAGGVSPLDADDSFRAQEAVYADAWFRTIAHETFG